MKRKLKMEVAKEKILLEIILNSTLVLTEIMNKKKRKKRRAVWVKDWLKRREQKGAYNNIISELRLVDLLYYTRYIHMNPATSKVKHYYYKPF